LAPLTPKHYRWPSGGQADSDRPTLSPPPGRATAGRSRGEGAIMPSLAELEAAAELGHRIMPPSPQTCWPVLGQRCGAEAWSKPENHTPIGAFKVRGGLTYMHRLRQEQPGINGVICATRGNHGQSVGYAARRHGLTATVVVPHGNNPEKNAAMRALGVELVEHGHDFQAASEHATELAADRGRHRLPSFHSWLVEGVASYGLELFRAVPDLDTVYVPIGLGSGICGTIAARDALGLATRIVGVVAENAPCYALSFAAGRSIPTNSADTLADGMPCRVPDAGALGSVRAGAERIVTVSEAAIRAAMRHYFTDTHNVAEGAGAAPLAAALKERDTLGGRRVGLVLSGGNIDRPLFAEVLAED